MFWVLTIDFVEGRGQNGEVEYADRVGFADFLKAQDQRIRIVFLLSCGLFLGIGAFV